ncbi:hypothetical protein V2A84_00470 [Yersinia sp. 2553 StPb PI]|uniref:hypothetical protein n=1 Tax=Yersinia sp. 2553 StPb PI TaxID=3117411 RepID=UPI003FA439D4
MNNTSQHVLGANSVNKSAESQLPNNINDNNRCKSSPSVMRKITRASISIINAVFILIMTLFNIVGWLAVAIPIIAFWVFVACYDNSVVINREFITNLVHLSSTISVLVLFAYIALVWGFKRKVPFVYE